MNQLTYKMNSGLDIPAVGLGVWKTPEGREVEQSVEWALEIGYRLIDTAKIYGNEQGVGKAIKNSGVPRDQIFVTTKLWNSDQGQSTTLKAIDESLEKLGLDYVDLYLVHWPYAAWPFEKKDDSPAMRQETWQAMEQIYKSGKAKTIGVSNYTIKHLEEMNSYAKIPPVVNQVEFHPFLYQKELLDYCKQNNIIIEAYCPLVHGEKLHDPRIGEIAQKYDKTNAQVLLRWSLQHGNIVIPKSTHRERLEENFQVFDFELAGEDMVVLDSMDENYRVGGNPNV